RLTIHSLAGKTPDPSNPYQRVVVNNLFFRERYSSSEYFPPPVMKMVKPEATPNTPICHSSRQVVPSQPEPRRMPIARLNTPILIRRVNKPSINNNPTTPSIMVKEAIAHHRASG